jgi:hypothetical protein
LQKELLKIPIIKQIKSTPITKAKIIAVKKEKGKIRKISSIKKKSLTTTTSQSIAKALIKNVNPIINSRIEQGEEIR